MCVIVTVAAKRSSVSRVRFAVETVQVGPAEHADGGMAAPTALASQAASSNAQLTRTLERLLEDAQHTGELKLNGRKLKELPPYAAKYDLRDIVQAGETKRDARASGFKFVLCALHIELGDNPPDVGCPAPP